MAVKPLQEWGPPALGRCAKAGQPFQRRNFQSELSLPGRGHREVPPLRLSLLRAEHEAQLQATTRVTGSSSSSSSVQGDALPRLGSTQKHFTAAQVTHITWPAAAAHTPPRSSDLQQHHIPSATEWLSSLSIFAWQIISI